MNFGTPLAGFSGDFQFAGLYPFFIGLMMYVPVGKYVDFQKRGQGIDDRYADTVQSTGHLVRVVIELAAGMQFGHNDFERRNLLGFVDSDRNPAAVVDDGDTVVMVDNDLNKVTVPRHGLIDAVVDHFVNEMMKTGSVNISDIHGRTFANGLKSFQNLDVIFCIIEIIVFFVHTLIGIITVIKLCSSSPERMQGFSSLTRSKTTFSCSMTFRASMK